MLKMKSPSNKGLDSWVKGKEYQEAAEYDGIQESCVLKKNGRMEFLL